MSADEPGPIEIPGGGFDPVVQPASEPGEEFSSWF